MQIDIEDYIDEASTRVLVNELKKRNGYSLLESRFEDEESLEQLESFNKLSTLGKVKQVLKLKPYATKAEIINEINEL